MHSRIFQVSTEPIEKDNYITYLDYSNHWFLEKIADYVANGSRKDDIDWLSESAKGIEVKEDEKGIFLIVTDKQKYFEDRYSLFFKTLESLNRIVTLECFSNGYNYCQGISSHIYRLGSYYEDEFGFYVDNEGNLETLDEFVRYCELFTEYYIGGTVDYHY